jgi:hypothetical protein
MINPWSATMPTYYVKLTKTMYTNIKADTEEELQSRIDQLFAENDSEDWEREYEIIKPDGKSEGR